MINEMNYLERNILKLYMQFITFLFGSSAKHDRQMCGNLKHKTYQAQEQVIYKSIVHWNIGIYEICSTLHNFQITVSFRLAGF